MSSVGLWHVVNGQTPVRLAPQNLPAEKQLEDWIEADPSIIAPSLHSVRRQVPLGGKFMDVLAVEAPGTWVICELKKMRLEREVLAQALDYLARLQELNFADFRNLVTEKSQDLPLKSRELIAQALSREENGEGREIRIVLAGIGVKEDLTRMVNSLSGNYGVPIQVCTLSALSAPDGNGFILMRDTSDDVSGETAAESLGSTYTARMQSVKEAFDNAGTGRWIEGALDIVSKNENLYSKPWKKAVTIAPSTHHGRFLFYYTPRGGGVYTMLGLEAIEEFFPDADMQALEQLPTEKLFKSEADLLEWTKSISDAIGNVGEVQRQPSPAWNGKDWYVCFGDDETRSWNDAKEHGFISAGGGDWYSKTLKNLPVGANIYVYIPKVGYVGRGETIGEAVRFEDAEFVKNKHLNGTYTHSNGEEELLVPVRWHKTLNQQAAIAGVGLFANQNSACKLRDPKTLEKLKEVFQG
jgi:hypothetical protein